MARNVYYKPVRLILGFIVGAVIAYIVAARFGLANAKTISIAMIAVALVLMILVPRVSPRRMTYDLNTPTTSSIIGNLVTRMCTTYFSIELLVGAFFIHYGFDRVFLCFFIQLALLIVFASTISYAMARDSRKAGEEDPLSARLGAAMGTDRVEQLKRQARLAKAEMAGLGDEARGYIVDLVAALEKATKQSYEGTLKVESQIGSLLDRLGMAARNNDSAEAAECARLAGLLVGERESYFSGAFESIEAEKAEERKQEFDRRRGEAFIKASREARAKEKADKAARHKNH